MVQSSTITLWSTCVPLMTFHYLESSTVFQLCKKENLYSKMVDVLTERLTESRCFSLSDFLHSVWQSLGLSTDNLLMASVWHHNFRNHWFLAHFCMWKSYIILDLVWSKIVFLYCLMLFADTRKSLHTHYPVLLMVHCHYLEYMLIK